MKVEELKKKFIEKYGGEISDIRIFTSPGRVNLIGEHTDYNGGYVFPAALTMGTTVAVRARNDRTVNLAATDLDCNVSASLDELDKYRNIEWGNYQLGVMDELQKAGYKLIGCDMLYDDTLPHGAGLSSSAAIEVSTALAMATLGNEAHGVSKSIDMVEMAKISQKAENNYVGVNCGIMDQFASAMGKEGKAIFLNCKNLEYKLVPLELQDCSIVISNTNVKRSLAVSKYNERRKECEEGFEILKKAIPEATCLGDITDELYETHKHLIKNEVIRKRVQHIIKEDDRVLKSIEALESNDIITFGKLMVESHNSLKNLYEVTGKELDTLVEEALKVEGVLGSRMTGAGFGGCTVSIVKKDCIDRFIEAVGKGYTEKTGLKASFYISDVGEGGREIK